MDQSEHGVGERLPVCILAGLRALQRPPQGACGFFVPALKPVHLAQVGQGAGAAGRIPKAGMKPAGRLVMGRGLRLLPLIALQLAEVVQ